MKTLADMISVTEQTSCLKPGFVGCVGPSTVPHFSNHFINALSRQSGTGDIESLLLTTSSTYVAVNGEIREQPYYGTSAANCISNLFHEGGGELNGIRYICSHINYSQYSIAILEKKETQITLWIYRQDGELYFTDLRAVCGQVFIFPTLHVFRNAVAVSPYKDLIPADHPIIELANNMIIKIRYDTNMDKRWDINKWNVTKTSYHNIAAA